MLKSQLKHIQCDATHTDAQTQNKTINFLCTHHRDWLYFNSHLGLDYLHQMQLKGEILAEQQCWQEALPQLGCAWETSQILLDIYGTEHLNLITRLGCLTVLLHHCLEQLEQVELAQQVCAQASNKLLQAVAAVKPETDEYAYIMQCIAHLRNPAQFSLYLMNSTSGIEQWPIH
ncbi:hypothetical protein [Planctobacterium marinum]|uniref:Uncharacterized protein n=1 Tax=Planctobacterium marinum TaxID=1631968 RepID=A0AA48HV21_9ALTE|nr:hypothetical protein MACH26_06310 [Planctobacterium marinum]